MLKGGVEWSFGSKPSTLTATQVHWQRHPLEFWADSYSVKSDLTESETCRELILPTLRTPPR
jgi:hypothetical protein